MLREIILPPGTLDCVLQLMV